MSVNAKKVTIKNETYKIEAGVYTGTRVYQVEFEDPETDTQVALVADDGTRAVPVIGEPWKAGDFATARDITAVTSDQAPEVHMVTVNYSSKTSGQEAENPLARTPEYDWSGNSQSEAYFRDTDDAPCVNSAGDDFEQLPQRLVYQGTLTVTRNEATFDDADAETYRNTTNEDAETIGGTTYPAGTLFMGDIAAKGPNEENGITFFRKTYTMHKNVDGFDDQFEDRGLNQLSAGKTVPILDKAKQPVTTPYPLDGAGAAKANPTDTPATIARKPYKAKSWSALALT